MNKACIVITCFLILATIAAGFAGSVVSSYRGITIDYPDMHCKVDISFHVKEQCQKTDCAAFANDACSSCGDVGSTLSADFCARSWTRLLIRLFAIFATVFAVIAGALFVFSLFRGFNGKVRFAIGLLFGLGSGLFLGGVFLYWLYNTNLAFIIVETITEHFYVGFFLVLAAGLISGLTCIFAIVSTKPNNYVELEV